MENQHDRIEIIERFCLGQMKPEELASFELMRVNDTVFAKEVEDYQTIFKMMKHSAIRTQMLATLTQLKVEDPLSFQEMEAQKYSETEQEILHSNKPIWKYSLRLVSSLVAAACLIFVLYASFSVVQLPGSENDLTIVRDIDPEMLSPVQKNAFDHFYAGQSHISEGQFNAAVLDFEAVLKTPNLRPYFEQATQWHLLVAQLKSGQTDKAGLLYQTLNNQKDTVYPVGFLNKSKLWWQIFWANLF
ncbi:hypothetical protein VB796_18535 [Arcicella sp. LKC2W]|uniref:tetratricopeptide repeat protein n=1 Tax=Arcicella sp. LKC2W TaxID=2984198 RepID=UPI002B1ED305|nr:hypothetical protein [Arcicella sp. LKC2W]MEA5461066.1 hypothetical protein [Arcicella sp. LKC2W]